MKTHSLTLTPEQVRAKIEGRKTQHRIVMKKQPMMGWEIDPENPTKEPINAGGYPITCPFQIGDHIYYRETWQHSPIAHLGCPPFLFKAYSSEQLRSEWPSWKSPVTMPKEAARIWDEVIGIRVERLGDISEQDAIAEGVEKAEMHGNWLRYDRQKGQMPCVTYVTQYPILSYKTLHELKHGPGSWERDKDKWCWVVTTKNLSLTGKP